MVQIVLVLLYVQKLTLMEVVSLDMMELVFNQYQPWILQIQKYVNLTPHVLMLSTQLIQIVKLLVANAQQMEQLAA